jgi:hypothetical protein
MKTKQKKKEDADAEKTQRGRRSADVKQKKNCVICFFTATQLWMLEICHTTLWKIAALTCVGIGNQDAVF